MLSGPSTDERTYSPFGLADPTGVSSGITVGFTGHDHDADEGLIDMGGRVYDPRFGRFLTADPIISSPLSTQGYNRYAYADNDPINLTDPSGFAPSGSFTDGWDTPYVVGAGAFAATWLGVVTYAVIEALGGNGAVAPVTTTASLSPDFVVRGQNAGKAPGGAVSIGLNFESGMRILDARNTPLPAVPARSPTPGPAPTGSAKAQSLGRVGPEHERSRDQQAGRSAGLNSLFGKTDSPVTRLQLCSMRRLFSCTERCCSASEVLGLSLRPPGDIIRGRRHRRNYGQRHRRDSPSHPAPAPPRQDYLQCCD